MYNIFLYPLAVNYSKSNYKVMSGIRTDYTCVCVCIYIHKYCNVYIICIITDTCTVIIIS